jgi:uncharacterized membrane protein YdjX (TVP38/TMEM64 family)
LHAAVGEIARRSAEAPAGAFIAVLAYAAAGALFIPVTLLATATLAVWPGVAVAWAGGVLSATLSHAIGGRVGDRGLPWVPARIAAVLRRILTRQAFWSVVLMRLLPLGNFGALNIVAGAVRVPRRSFVLGNMVGLLPGLLGLGVVVDRLIAVQRRPSLFNIGAAIAVLAVVAAIAVIVKRRLAAPPRSGASGKSAIDVPEGAG